MKTSIRHDFFHEDLDEAVLQDDAAADNRRMNMSVTGLREMAREKLQAISMQRKWAHGRWLTLRSGVYDAAMKVEEATFVDGALSRKQKELIALGIGVITDCESCMQWHMEQAVKAGATQREVVETIEVAIEMGIVPATVHARFALEVMDTLFEKD